MLKEWQKRTDAGFSLIEILISVVILGILSAIVTVSVGGALYSANLKQCKTDFGTATLAANAWLNDNTNADGTVDFSSWNSSTASVRYSYDLYSSADSSGNKTLAGLAICSRSQPLAPVASTSLAGPGAPPPSKQ